MQKKILFGIIIIIVIAIILFGGVFAYQYFTKTQTPTTNVQQNPNVQNLNTETAGWKTYKNNQYGIEFSVPEDIAEYDTGTGIFNAPGYVAVNVFSLSNNETLQGYIDNFTKNQKAYNITQKNITVGGKNGIYVNRYFDVSPGSLSPETEVLIPLGSNKILDIGIVDKIFNDKDKTAEDKFLSTFKFTSQNSKSPYIKVLSPNGGEEIKFGDDLTINWESYGVSRVEIRVNYYDENGKIGNCSIPDYAINCGECGVTYEPISAYLGSFTIKDGNIGRCGTLLPGSRLKVSIWNMGLEDGFGYEYVDTTDYSDNYFTIVQNQETQLPPSSVKIVSPNGEETWRVGDTYSIEWQIPDALKDKYIELFLTDGPTPGDIKIAKSEDLKLNWKIPDEISDDDASGQIKAGNYKIKLVVYDGYPCSPTLPSCNHPKIIASDISDNYFTITK